jgi:hypothetical protein
VTIILPPDAINAGLVVEVEVEVEAAPRQLNIDINLLLLLLDDFIVDGSGDENDPDNSLLVTLLSPSVTFALPSIARAPVPNVVAIATESTEAATASFAGFTTLPNANELMESPATKLNRFGDLAGLSRGTVEGASKLSSERACKRAAGRCVGTLPAPPW